MKLRLVPLLAVVVLAGCSKIHEQRAFVVPPQGGNTLTITAPVSEQKITVVLSSDQPVNVWILLEKDVPSGDKDTFDPDAQMKSGVLAKEKNAKDVTLQATIPAKEKFQVYVNNTGSKQANVTVKIDSN
jgi:hypothetical protein